jgi:hypothetical protein
MQQPKIQSVLHVQPEPPGKSNLLQRNFAGWQDAQSLLPKNKFILCRTGILPVLENTGCETGKMC